MALKTIQALQGFLTSCQIRGAERWLKARREELSSVADLHLQTQAFAEKFSQLTPALAAEVIETLHRFMQQRKLEYEALYSSLLNPRQFFQAFSPRRRQLILDTLHRRGYQTSWSLLTADPSKEILSHAQEQAPAVTLGERITLAKKPSPRQIEKLLYDRDEPVIRMLLNNPRITEAEVLKIASFPRTWPAILQAVARHPRWSANYRVKLALIQNTNTPPGVALGLLNYLLLKDLDEVRQSAHLAPELKQTAENLLRERILSLSAQERSTLALGASPGLIKILLENPAPMVLLGLLDNPHLSGEEVLMIVQDPRTPAEILERIGKNLRWMVERPLALALIKHPQCPPNLRQRLHHYLIISAAAAKTEIN